ncbi:LAFA_0G03048g1_1 [Lachancea sp. 'fantastica']|nr:LAFA_0G03048g1_1 [Lachancea sp. 'fantastica']
MGTGDLNLLKSWNPHLLKNRKKVWETEQQLLEENQRLRERQQEIEKERQIDELTSLTRDGAEKKIKKSGLDWMYNDEPATREANKDFLLGKKRIEASLLNTEKPQEASTRKVTKSDITKQDNNLKSQKTPTNKNAELSRDDPLAAFQKAQLSHTRKKANKITKPESKYSKETPKKTQSFKSSKTSRNSNNDMDY